MKTIDKNKLNEAIDLYKKHLSKKSGKSEEYFKSLNLFNEMGIESFGESYRHGSLFTFIAGIFLMKRNITNEEIYNLIEMVGCEVE